jgi:hypothetical protein
MNMNLLQRLIVGQLLSHEQGSPLEARMTILRGITKKVRLAPDAAKAYSIELAPGQIVWDEVAMRAVETEVDLDEKERKLLGQTLGKCERMSIAQAEVLEPLLVELGLTL